MDSHDHDKFRFYPTGHKKRIKKRKKKEEFIEKKTRVNVAVSSIRYHSLVVLLILIMNKY